MRLLPVVLGLFAVTALASEVERAEITFARGAYTYHFEVLIEASADKVLAVVTDYDNLEILSDDVVEANIIKRYNDKVLKRRLWLHHCLLVFCFDLYFIENVEHLDNGEIVTTVIPGESNFSRGRSVWRVEAVSDHQTRISVEAEQDPDFWIPPVIGPIIFKRAFIKEVHKTAVNIERAALLRDDTQ
jgi:hypothetical protein